jgi:hypothetical protein
MRFDALIFIAVLLLSEFRDGNSRASGDVDEGADYLLFPDKFIFGVGTLPFRPALSLLTLFPHYSHVISYGVHIMSEQWFQESD